MYTKVIAVTAVTLYALLTFLASVVTDYYDRYYPQSIGVSSQIVLDFTESTLQQEDALATLQRLDRNLSLGLLKLLPDLDDAGAQVFVALNGTGGSRPVGWFGNYEPARIVGVDRLANSAADGTYFVLNDRALDTAVDDLSLHGVAVQRKNASPLDSVVTLAQEPGFAAPVIAASALIAAMNVFWLAIRARSRALRVLAGVSPWRIQVQDLGRLLVILALSAIAVAGASALLIGATRGWVFVPAFVTITGVFEGVTLAISVFVALVMSSASWPNADLFARRKPAVLSLRWAARIVQAVTLLTLIAFAGPAMSASLNAAQNARQLQAWTQLADQVQLVFGMNEKYLDVVAPQVALVVKGAEADGKSALSYAIKRDGWQGDFGEYSAIAFVNAKWISLISGSMGTEALKPVPVEQVSEMVLRELGPSLELWGGDGITAAAAVSSFAAFVPAGGVHYPVAEGGSTGRLSFLQDVLILKVPSIAETFDAQDVVSLASTGNIIFEGAADARARLRAEGVDADGLERRGIDGTMRAVYVAEHGILEGQFASYQAQLLFVSIIALGIAFLVAAAVNAMIFGLLYARRDFPLRVNGATWESTVRPRALRDVGSGAAIGIIVILAQPFETVGVTIAVALLGMAALYVSHWIAARLIFVRVLQRKL